MTATTSGRVFVDTNVLVYLHDQAEPTRQQVATAIMLNDDLDVVISAQVLSEFFVTVTRKLKAPLSIDDAVAVLNDLAELHVVPITRNLTIAAASTARTHQLSYWDSLIVEAASAGGAGVLLTEDLDSGTTLSGVEIRNPFV